MSIYRDTYVSIDGEYDKINAAYSYGGGISAPLSIEILTWISPILPP